MNAKTPMLLLALLPMTALACTPTEADPETPAAGDDAGVVDQDTGGGDTGDEADAGETTVDPSATCATTPKHPRCDADPGSYAGWDVSSVVSSIAFVAGDTCCFDIDDDGTDDNALGELLELAADLDVDVESFNASIAESIAEGSLVLLVEHQGVASAGGPFSINYYLGAQVGDFTAPSADGGNPYTVTQGSLTQGVWPSARMPEATHDGTTLTAGPGEVDITTELLGPPLTLRITAAQIRAKVDTSTTYDSDGGVRLVDGALGGAVRVADIFDSVNDVYDGSCGCAPLPDGQRLVTYDPAKLSDAECSAPENDTSACDPDSTTESVCITAYDLCGFVGLAGLVADVDADDPTSACVDLGTCDSISLATTFETVGARIEGVSE